MNKIDFSQIVDPTKRQPLLGPSVDFLQNAYIKGFDAVFKGLIGNNYSSIVGYCFYGVVNSPASVVSGGYFFYGGEFYEFAGINNYNTFSNTGVFVLSVTNPSPDPITFSDGTTGNVHNIRKLSLVDQVNGTGLFNYSDVVYYRNLVTKTKVIEIGNWDMVATSSVSVNHGLTGTKIRNIRAMIRDDSNTNLYPLDFQADGWMYATGAQAVLIRKAGGSFDNTAFDTATSWNRGWVTIDYID